MVLSLALAGFYWFFFIHIPSGGCLQAFHKARNPITHEIRSFSSSCMPIGWQNLGFLEGDVMEDPKTGARIVKDSLVILASGQNINELIKEFDGTITLNVKETDTYRVKFPVKNFQELEEIRTKLEARGLTVVYDPVIDPQWFR